MHKFTFQNKAVSTLPAFGCGRLKSILSTDPASGQPVFELVKPDGVAGIYVVNGPNNVAVNSYGVATIVAEATLVLIDDGSAADAPVFGEACGPTSGRWAATKDGFELLATGEINNKVMPVVAKGDGSGSGGSGGCACTCIANGDIIVNGIETTSRWSVAMSAQIFKQTYGHITFPAGKYIVVWNVVSSTWTLDIGADLTAAYLSGADATSATTMDGTLTLTWSALGAAPILKLCVDGTIPAPSGS